MKVVDIFGGIGGFSLGLERAGMETVAFCDTDKKCRQVLKKHWPGVPQYNDVRTLTAGQLKNDGITNIGLICGGYPCQPFSLAGKRDGEKDDRHLWPEIKRLLAEFIDAGEPIPWCLFENVTGHISLGLDSVLSDLEALAYTCWPLVIPACAVGAYHRRDRVWIIARSNELANGKQYVNEAGTQPDDSEGTDIALANANDPRQHPDSRGWSGERSFSPRNNVGRSGENVADPNCREQSLRGHNPGMGREQQSIQKTSANSIGVELEEREILPQREGQAERTISREAIERACEWETEPSVGRVVDGFPGRVDRLKQLGNSVVPQVAEEIGRAIMEANSE